MIDEADSKGSSKQSSPSKRLEEEDDGHDYGKFRDELSDEITQILLHRRTKPTACMHDEGLRAMGVFDDSYCPVKAADAIDELVSQLLHEPHYGTRQQVVKLSPGWIESLAANGGKGGATLGPIYYINILWAILVVAFFRYHVDVVPGIAEDPWVDMKAIPLLLISVGLMFLVVFRTQTSYKKWNQARTAWVQTHSSCRGLATQACIYLKDLDAASSVCRYLVVYVLSVRFWLRQERIPEDLVCPLLTAEGYKYITEHAEPSTLQEKIDADKNLSFHFKHVTAPIPVIGVLRSILKHEVESKQMGPFQSMMESNCKTLQQSMHIMERVLDTQLPFAYITHVRTAICIYTFMIPLFLVKMNGWYTVLFVAFYCYVVLGLENLAVEIENPFGTDANDLPMNVYCCTISRDVCDVLRRRLALTAKVKDNFAEGEEHSDVDDDDDDGGDDDD